MEMFCKGISENECFRMAIEEYELQLADKKAVTQARTQPLRQALRVFKWLRGYGGKWTIQHNKKDCDDWEAVKLQVMKRYRVWDIREIPPELLGEANLYAINLVMEAG